MAGRETGWVFKGFDDPSDSAQYMPVARKYLGMMKQRMRGAGIRTLTWRRQLANGVFIKVSSNFGIDSIVIGGTLACTTCPPFTETDESRTYWTDYITITSSDGLFTWEYRPIKTMTFIDSLGQTVEFNFDEPG